MITRKEYEELMTYLFQEKIRRAGLHRRFLHRLELHDHFGYLIDEMSEGYLRHARTPHRQTDLKIERDYVRSVQHALSESTQIAEEVGMLDVLEDYELLIRQGMEFRDMPQEDSETLRMLGETDPRGALLAAFHKEKSRASFFPPSERYNDEPRTPASSLRRGEERIRNTGDRLDEHIKLQEASDEHISDEKVRPSRRWFKGLGKIAQGSALTMADVCLAARDPCRSS
jgi:hypothetical protein